MRTDSEHILLYKISNNDPKAFEALFTRYWEDVYYQASRKVSSMEDASDLTQEVFYAIWKGRYSLDVKGSVRGYILGVLRNKIYDFYQKQNKEPQLIAMHLLNEEWVGDESGSSETYEERLALIEIEINAMPERMRRVFVLSKYHGMSAKQISGQLNISIQTVRNQISTALKRIRKNLEK